MSAHLIPSPPADGFLPLPEMWEISREIKYEQVFKYLQLATVVVLFYDSILTSPREVELFRHRRWCLVSILHLIIRILAFVDNSFVLARGCWQFYIHRVLRLVNAKFGTLSNFG